MAVEVVEYTPPPTCKAFIRDYRPSELFYSWVVGPLGSGKTTANFFKLAYMAKLQKPGFDGVRRSRAVIVRSTWPQLRDTTLKSWSAWFRDGVAGKWYATDKNFILKFDDVECEVLFRPLDTDEDIARVLSLELTFAIVDEFIQIPRAIIDSLAGRLGRFPAKKDGGATNWGMWGSSNPGTEDIWWHDYLHNLGEFAGDAGAKVEHIQLYGSPEHVGAMRALLAKARVQNLGSNVRYFHQPSGLTSWAENVDNLPGGAGYYANQTKGRSAAWVKQFVDAEWGFSASETPVVKTFQPNFHVSRQGTIFQPVYTLVGGFDPGLAGTAMVFGQEDMHGRLLILGEVGAVGMGATRFITERVKPYLRHYFPGADFLVAPDPASANRGQNDEVAVVSTIRKHFKVVIETNNHLAKRIDAVESYTSRMTELGPALLIDKERCPMTTRAFSGGWRFGKVPRGSEIKPSPEKNAYSHFGDAAGYLARYFHRQYERTGQRGQQIVRAPQQRAVGFTTTPFYHLR